MMTSMDHVPPQPTPEQVETNAPIQLPDGRTGYACWYPQMGGYVAMCVVVPVGDGCFDAYVWHDGQFPFDDGGHVLGGLTPHPAFLRHSDPQQFIDFGRLVRGWTGARWPEKVPDAPE